MNSINDYIYCGDKEDKKKMADTLAIIENKFHLVYSSLRGFIINKQLYFLAYDVSEIVKSFSEKSEAELFKGTVVFSIDKNQLQLSSFEYGEFNISVNIISKFDTYKVFYNAIRPILNEDDIVIFNAWFNYTIDRIINEHLVFSTIISNLKK